MKPVFRSCALRLAGFLMLPAVLGAAQTEVAPPGVVINHAIPPPEVRFAARFSSAASETVIWEDGSVPVPAMNGGRGHDYVVRLAAWRMDRSAASFAFPGRARKMRGHRFVRTLAYNPPPPGYQIRVDEHSTPFGEWLEVQIPWANYVDNPSEWGPGWFRNSAEYRVIGSSPLLGLKVRWVEAFYPGDQTALQTTMREWVIDGPQSPVFTLAPSVNSYVEVRGLEVEYPEITLAVDANRDGTIKLAREDASDATTAASPYRFWLNDDDDSEDTGGSDIPGDGSNDFGTGIAGPPGLGSDFGVDGNRDLVDWFPVFLDLKQLLTVLPPSASVKYKLKHEGYALSFVYTDLTRDRAFAYQEERLVTGFGFNLDRAPGEAQATQITATGAILSDEFLMRIKDQNAGVILVETGAATDKPLVLSVEKDGTVIVKVKLELKIVPVETMFRHLNLREGSDAPGGLVGNQRDTGPATRLGNPVDAFPDTSADQPWFIFVVGSNVGGQSARGWESETFKRLYWSKSNARFLGVSWFGDPYANGSDGVYDYHLAVRNAFATAPALASAVNGLSGTGSKTIAGHSLACGLISSALSDHGMNVAHAALIDAAIAREVFDGRVGSGDQLGGEESGMTPVIWRDYDLRLQSSNWHERFASVSGDSRQTLTWRNRFIGAVPKIHSFYSSTEDALGAYDGEVPTTSLGAAAVVVTNGASFSAYVWVYQEKAKGNRQDYFLPFLGSFHAGSTYGGWGFNLTDPLLNGDPVWYVLAADPITDAIGRRRKTPAEIGSLTQTTLDGIGRSPLFKTGWGRWDASHPEQTLVDTNYFSGPSFVYDLFRDSSGSAVAADATKRAQLLAEAIPAQSLPVGANQVNSSTILLSKQHNLPVEFTDPGWPRPIQNGVREWRHSDMREVAYLYQSRFWDELVSISQQP